MIVHEPFNTFGDLADFALRVCEDDPVLNLILSVRAPLGQRTEAFLEAYRSDAEDWQAETKPARLFINHGEYLHRNGDWLRGIVSQLRDKPSGNRACATLARTDELLTSGDAPVPSFLLIQAGFEPSTQTVLYLTAYYRALEVNSFLPINLAEMDLIARSIAEAIPSIAILDLTIHAFRAHSIPGFVPLIRSTIDTVTSDVISEVAISGDGATLSTWIADKAKPGSVIEVDSLAFLATEMENAVWSLPKAEAQRLPLVTDLRAAISTLSQLRTARERGTHAATIERLQDRALDELRRCLARSRDIPAS